MTTLTIQQIYDYAKLSTLAYVDVSSDSNYLKTSTTPDLIIQVAKRKNAPGNSARIPESLGTQMLAPDGAIQADLSGHWTVLDPYFKASAETGTATRRAVLPRCWY